MSSGTCTQLQGCVLYCICSGGRSRAVDNGNAGRRAPNLLDNKHSQIRLVLLVVQQETVTLCPSHRTHGRRRLPPLGMQCAPQLQPLEECAIPSAADSRPSLRSHVVSAPRPQAQQSTPCVGQGPCLRSLEFRDSRLTAPILHSGNVQPSCGPTGCLPGPSFGRGRLPPSAAFSAALPPSGGPMPRLCRAEAGGRARQDVAGAAGSGGGSCSHRCRPGGRFRVPAAAAHPPC